MYPTFREDAFTFEGNESLLQGKFPDISSKARIEDYLVSDRPLQLNTPYLLVSGKEDNLVILGKRKLNYDTEKEAYDETFYNMVQLERLLDHLEKGSPDTSVEITGAKRDDSGFSNVNVGVTVNQALYHFGPLKAFHKPNHPVYLSDPSMFKVWELVLDNKLRKVISRVYIPNALERLLEGDSFGEIAPGVTNSVTITK